MTHGHGDPSRRQRPAPVKPVATRVSDGIVGILGSWAQSIAQWSATAARNFVLRTSSRSLGAHLRALEQGADGLECDVRLTRDGHLVSVHDRRLNRTSNSLSRAPPDLDAQADPSANHRALREPVSRDVDVRQCRRDVHFALLTVAVARLSA